MTAIGDTREQIASRFGTARDCADDAKRAGRFVRRLLITAARRRWQEARALMMPRSSRT